MTRVRYKEQLDGTFVSTQPILTANDAAKVVLNLSDLTFSVFALESDVLLLTGTASNFSGLKKAAKGALLELGATFTSEVRVRTKGVSDETSATVVNFN